MQIADLHSELLAGQQLLEEGRNEAGISRMENALHFYRQIEAAPERIEYQPSKDIPISLRIIALNWDMAVALCLLADAYLVTNRRMQAIQSLTEAVERFEKAEAHAGFETKVELRELATTARQRLEEVDWMSQHQE